MFGTCTFCQPGIRAPDEFSTLMLADLTAPPVSIAGVLRANELQELAPEVHPSRLFRPVNVNVDSWVFGQPMVPVVADISVIARESLTT